MKKFNFNEFIWFVILASFSIYIYYLFLSGKISTYIHPKMFKYAIFSLIVFGSLSIFQARKVFSRQKPEKIKFGFLIFLAPLLLGIILNPSSLGAKVVSNKGINISKNAIFNQGNKKVLKEEKPNKSNENLAESEEFKKTLVNVYDNLHSIKGSPIEIKGFVYKDEGFSKNRFVVSRLMLSCCAADTEIVGVLCEWQNGEKLKQDKWVNVKGIVESTKQYNQYTNKEETIPLIKVVSVEEVEVPENQYIYP